MGLFGGLAKVGGTVSGIGDALGYGMDYAMGNEEGMRRFEKRRDEAEERRLRMQQVEQLSQGLKARGFSDGDIALAMSNPESIGANFNQSFRFGDTSRSAMPAGNAATGPWTNLLYDGFRMLGGRKGWDPAGLNR
jgi:hypothetical protein